MIKTRLSLKYIKTSDLEPTKLIKEKISKAEEIYEHFGKYFSKDNTLKNMLNEYEKAVINSNTYMKNLGSFEECYKCTVIDKKGCCKRGLETEVTINIILINLLLKKEVPKEREFEDKCFFVGEKGCKLFARPYICRDYFCKRLLNLFNNSYIILTQILNTELVLLYKISTYIKKELESLTGEFLLELDITG